MKNKPKNSGFSLTEMLLAIGILSVGMVFIAGVFPVAIHFMTVSTERTIAAVVADEAFAKIKLYGVQSSLLTASDCVDFNDVSSLKVPPYEFRYPSTYTDILQKHYCFSALCRLAAPNSRLVQVTVFINRKTGPNLTYPDPDGGSGTVNWPMPVKVAVAEVVGRSNELSIDSANEKTFINDGCRILDNAAGRLYRVMERYAPPSDNIVLLDRDWDDSPPGGLPNAVWVVPPPTGGGRYPCITVYQKEIRF